MARSRALGGRPVNYRIPFRADNVISARALAAVEVKRLVRQVRQERDRASGCPAPNSFLPGTQVLMADGGTKDIEDVRVGEEVLAASPETGETGARPVLATITGTGDKNLVRVEAGGGSVTATGNHPFWVAGDVGAWVEAADLEPGMWLRTGAGTHVQVTATDHRTAHDRRVHNLTVADLHTYHVRAGGTSALVHNDCKDARPAQPPRHVALGRRANNLKGFADKVGGQHLLGATTDTWRDEVRAAIARAGRGETRISFMLDGLPGDTRGPKKALEIARKTPESRLLDTQWELLQVDDAGLMGKVDFYRWNRRSEQWARVEYK
ncbi:hypothetical protein F7P10_06300 [Actinomadura sp. WMMB 499]|nr:hypothetical protein F7P10_06300 [Actinomadura sp. WMMB 499]